MGKRFFVEKNSIIFHSFRLDSGKIQFDNEKVHFDSGKIHFDSGKIHFDSGKIIIELRAENRI